MGRTKQTARKSTGGGHAIVRVELPVKGGSTPVLRMRLLEAIQSQDVAKVRALLKKRLDDNWTNEVPEALGNIAILKMLLDAGAPLEADVDDDCLTSSPLAAAASEGLLPAVQLLLARGANVNGVDGKHRTALSHAILADGDADKVAIVDALLEAGADPDGDGEGDSPLHHLVRSACDDDAGWAGIVVERLLSKGADIEEVDSKDRTLAESALLHDCPRFVWGPIVVAAVKARDRWR
jgi:ankyrin repeat protein